MCDQLCFSLLVMIVWLSFLYVCDTTDLKPDKGYFLRKDAEMRQACFFARSLLHILAFAVLNF